MTNNHMFTGPSRVICSIHLNFGLQHKQFQNEQNMRKLARNPILRRMTQKITFYETVCNKMLGVCTPNWWTAPYFSEFTRDFSWHLSCFVSFRNGVLGASYLPAKIVFDPKVKRIHPEPIKEAKWITLCGKKDKQCVDNCHDPPPRKNKT